MNYSTKLLHATDKTTGFSSGTKILDRYLHQYALKDMNDKSEACFVALDQRSRVIKGYYTLANNGIPLNRIPKKLQQKLPKSYRTIPVTFLDKLAVDERYQEENLETPLLIDGLRRSYETSKTIGAFAVVVNPMDKETESFYGQFGFLKLPDSQKLFLAMKTIRQLFA